MFQWTFRIGKKISTKVPDGLPVRGGGARIREDITDEYKFPDGTSLLNKTLLMHVKTFIFNVKFAFQLPYERDWL